MKKTKAAPRSLYKTDTLQEVQEMEDRIELGHQLNDSRFGSFTSQCFPLSNELNSQLGVPLKLYCTPGASTEILRLQEPAHYLECVTCGASLLPYSRVELDARILECFNCGFKNNLQKGLEWSNSDIQIQNSNSAYEYEIRHKPFEDRDRLQVWLAVIDVSNAFAFTGLAARFVAVAKDWVTQVEATGTFKHKRLGFILFEDLPYFVTQGDAGALYVSQFAQGKQLSNELPFSLDQVCLPLEKYSEKYWNQLRDVVGGFGSSHGRVSTLNGHQTSLTIAQKYRLILIKQDWSKESHAGYF